MSNINDGGPAFPVLERGGNGLELSCMGMTLRDYFAAKAMTIMWDAYDKGYTGVNCHDFDNDTLAKGAYQVADAMLRVREQQP